MLGVAAQTGVVRCSTVLQQEGRVAPEDQIRTSWEAATAPVAVQ